MEKYVEIGRPELRGGSVPDPEEMPRRTDDSHLAERLDAVLALPELALILDTDVAQEVLVVNDIVADADIVPGKPSFVPLTHTQCSSEGRRVRVRSMLRKLQYRVLHVARRTQSAG